MRYRDDDVSCFTDLTTFIKIHELFKKYNKTHICVVEMQNLWESKGIWYLLMTEPNIQIGLHGWDHKDYSKVSRREAEADIKKSLEYFKQHTLEGFGRIVPITTFYPPWNRKSPALEAAVRNCGLVLDNNTNPQEVFGFHWWDALGKGFLQRLEGALSHYEINNRV